MFCVGNITEKIFCCVFIKNPINKTIYFVFIKNFVCFAWLTGTSATVSLS